MLCAKLFSLFYPGISFKSRLNSVTFFLSFQPKYYRKIVSYRYSGGKRIPEFSDGCFKCECEATGSTGEYCSVKGGQCPCQEGQKGAKNVVGRRCNQCEDKQGQIVRFRGCVGECVIHYLNLGCHGVTQNFLFMVPPAIWERCCVTPVTKVYPISHACEVV